MVATDRGIEESQGPGGEGEEEEGLDVEGLKERLGFVFRAPRRHPWLASSVFVAIAALGITVSVIMPRVFNSTVKLLGQRTMMIPAVTNPGVQLHDGDFTPTKDVADVIRRRENLVELVTESNLVQRFYAARAGSFASRTKDKLMAALTRPQTDDEKLHAVVGTLEKNLQVASDADSVTISVDWPDPNTAYSLVTQIQKNFMDAKYDSDVAMVGDAVGLLEQHAKTELEQVDTALGEFETARNMATRGTPEPAAPAPAAIPVAGAPAIPRPAAAPRRVVAAPDADLAQALEDKRREIKTFEDDHQRQLDGLKQQLMQAELTLTAQHPTVVALQQKVDQLSQPSPELARLKSEERALMAQLAPAAEAGSSAAPAGGTGIAAPRSPTSAPSTSLAQSAAAEREDPALAAPRARLEDAIRHYQDIESRIDGAKLQLDIIRTAYSYRYRVITPAEVAPGPKKPIALMVAIASVLGGALFGVLAAVFADWASGILLEAWQVRRILKLEILTELDPPP
jgi:uncharacterized protein involved in exopolysaccharide biosynthesis